MLLAALQVPCEEELRFAGVEGVASRRILDQEQEADCDLVVGRPGQSAAEELLPGCVTRHVLAEGGSDVLVSTLHTAPAAV